MKPLDKLLLDAKMIDLRYEVEQDSLVARAEALGLETRPGLRARVGGWLVQAGLWLDPRLDEHVRIHQPARRMADR